MHGFSSWIFNNVFQKLKRNVKQLASALVCTRELKSGKLHGLSLFTRSKEQMKDIRVHSICCSNSAGPISKFIKYWIYKRSKELKSELEIPATADVFFMWARFARSQFPLPMLENIWCVHIEEAIPGRSGSVAEISVFLTEISATRDGYVNTPVRLSTSNFYIRTHVGGSWLRGFLARMMDETEWYAHWRALWLFLEFPGQVSPR